MHILEIHRAFPADYRLEIYPFQEGDPQYAIDGGNGLRQKMGTSVQNLRNQFGGADEGIITGGFGEKYRISLQPWADSDPATTFLYQEHGSSPKIPFHMDSRLRDIAQQSQFTASTPETMYLKVDKHAPPPPPPDNSPRVVVLAKDLPDDLKKIFKDLPPDSLVAVPSGKLAPDVPRLNLDAIHRPPPFMRCSDVRFEHKLKLQLGDAARKSDTPQANTWRYQKARRTTSSARLVTLELKCGNRSSNW